MRSPFPEASLFIEGEPKLSSTSNVWLQLDNTAAILSHNYHYGPRVNLVIFFYIVFQQTIKDQTIGMVCGALQPDPGIRNVPDSLILALDKSDTFQQMKLLLS
jgi:hypothetical protein